MKHLKSVTMLLLLLAAVFTFSACGGDDGGGSSDSGGGVTPSGSGTYSQADLVGAWTGFNSDASLAVVMRIYQDGTGELVLFRYENSDYVQIFDEKIKYQFNTNSGELFVTYSDNSTEKFMITNQTYNSFTFYVGDTAFRMERYTGDGGGSQSGYAPDQISNCIIRIIHIGQAFNIYFTSNTTIRSEYSNIPLPQSTVTGARYAKTGANTATVDIDYYNGVLKKSNTYSFNLTFTSETEGTTYSENMNGTFTITNEGSADYVSAPENISYMTFTTDPNEVTSKWWTFGAQVNGEAKVTSYGGIASSLTYYSHYASYFRSSNTSAVLTISTKLDRESSESNTAYTLEFQTSNSGRYTSSTYSPFTGKTTKLSGKFTLE